MALAKMFKKGYRTVKKSAKKRYTSKSGGVAMSKLVRDLALVKASLNVEKKVLTSQVVGGVYIGQTNGTSNTGWEGYDITPPITQGVGSSQRTGNSVKLVSMAIKGQIRQMTDNRHPMKIKIQVFRVIGVPSAISTIVPQVYDNNVITQLIDYNSERNINYFKSYRLMATRYVYLQPDPVGGETMIKEFNIIMKMNHHIKWENDSTTVTDGQLAFIFTADSGNASPSVAATDGTLPILATNTGANAQFFTRFYYVDN